MTNSSASWAEDMTEETARIADDSLVVRARFVEAADTIAHLDVRMTRPAAVRSLWPAFQGEIGTVGGHAAGYGMNGERIRYLPSSAAISRAEEVMQDWLLHHIADDKTRIIVLNWSMCLAVPHIAGSFRSFCKKRGLSRSTAERRLPTAFSSVASALRKSAQSLHHPDWPRVVPRLPFSDSEIDRITTPPPPSPTSWIAPGAKPTHRADWHEPEPKRAAR